MKRILVVGEDALSCAIGERLVQAALPGWELAGPAIDTRGVTKLHASLSRYVDQARYGQPVLCVADTDGQCVVRLRSMWLQGDIPQKFVLRYAVTESESWLLADRDGFSEALRVPLSKVPMNPDEIRDPKRLVLALAARSKVRRLREEVVSSSDSNKPGAGYNLHLCNFARARWDAARASQHSASLARSLGRLKSALE